LPIQQRLRTRQTHAEAGVFFWTVWHPAGVGGRIVVFNDPVEGVIEEEKVCRALVGCTIGWICVEFKQITDLTTGTTQT